MTRRNTAGPLGGRVGWTLAICLTLLTVAAGPAVRAQAPPTGPRFIDKSLGEEEEIRQREAWFLMSRQAGTSSDQEMRKLRWAGVEFTRDALAAQRVRQSQGYESVQNVWASMGPSPSTFGGWSFGTIAGRIQAIEADWASGTLYVGAASGGVWKSTNDGLSWTSIFDSAGTVAVGAIEVDPNDPDVLWVGTGDNIVGCVTYFGIGMMRSTDGGQTWELRNGTGPGNLSDASSFAGITVDPRDSNKVVAGGRYSGCTTGTESSGGIYTTVDAGETWTEALANKYVHEIARDPSNPDILWASSSNGVHKSVDNGANWILQTADGLPNGNLGRTELTISPADPDIVYVLFDSPSDQFWRTTDGGVNWQMMNADACDGQCSYNMVIRAHPTIPDLVYRGTIKIFRSTNGGANWEQLTNNWGSSQQVHQDTQSMLVNPTGLNYNTVYVGSDGGIWKSINAGINWTNINGNLNVTQFYAIDVNHNEPGLICGGAQDNSSIARNNDNVWSLQAVTGDGMVCQINSVDPNYAYITSYPSNGFPNVWRATNGLFGNFQDISGPGSGISANDRIAWVTPYTLDPTSPNVVYLGTHRAYRSLNHGSNWTQVGPADLTKHPTAVLLSLEVNRSYPNVLYSGASSGAVWRSADGGDNWSDISSGLPFRTIGDIAGDPTNPGRAFAVVGGFGTAHLWEWNEGSDWVERGTGLPNVPANTVVMLSDKDLLIGTDTGIFRSFDGGQTVVPYMQGLPEGLVVTDLKYSQQQQIMTAGTYGRGAWQVEMGGLQPILLPESVEQPLVEIDGDGDVIIEPGETWSVRPILHNVGGETAVDVTARLASPTPGVTILTPDVQSFGDITPTSVVAVPTAYQFTLDPSFDCGLTLVFDLVDIVSSTPPGQFEDRPGIYSTLIQDGNLDPVESVLLDEDFDPEPVAGWSHEAVDSDSPFCSLLTFVDEWSIDTKDAEHGQSFHLGNGPGSTYAKSNYAWLHPSGKDSDGAPGIQIPADAIGATLRLVHWYDTAPTEDGGQVAIDFIDDGQDLYETLEPLGGYAGSPLVAGGCNGLEGQKAFQGLSAGWVSNVFDLMPYKGGSVWISFVFGSDSKIGTGEGWYIDEAIIEIEQLGAPACDVARWPGVVPSAHFDLLDPTTIEASWGDACNAGEFPEQTYSIQSGDLTVLHDGGGYTHAAVGDACDLLSTTTFTPGPGNEYYLVVPSAEGREGGAGVDSSGSPRPQPAATCGLRRVACP